MKIMPLDFACCEVSLCYLYKYIIMFIGTNLPSSKISIIMRNNGQNAAFGLHLYDQISAIL
jgi:hypothetical protein